MKYKSFCGILLSAVLLGACGEAAARSSYHPILPVVPPGWEILGEPHWRVEWVDGDGAWREWEGGSGDAPPGISLPGDWCTPVLAWPFWPEWNLSAGVMRPSGAMFPWDTAGDRLNLSWKGGVDAALWKEMAKAERFSAAEGGRLPWYFDWPRFRELFESEHISEDVRQDPWLADWKKIARDTVQSGFDRRRIVPRNFTEVSVSGVEGTWTGSSPFAHPLTSDSGTPLVLRAGDTAETWISASGVLKCSTSGWVFIPRR